jgi:hypothetical protein
VVERAALISRAMMTTVAPLHALIPDFAKHLAMLVDTAIEARIDQAPRSANGRVSKGERGIWQRRVLGAHAA